ncbi:MAG: CHC2 zinc finger domain-containing protein [Aggregatilineales bacterium]
MIDPQRLKATCDLRRLLEQDLGPAAVRGGRAHLWKCPFHHERKGCSLAVWLDGYRCFGACDTGGDAIDWLVNYRRLSFTQAVEVLVGRADDRPRVLCAERFLRLAGD